MKPETALAVLDRHVPVRDDSPATVPPRAVARILNCSCEHVLALARQGRLPRPARIGMKTYRFESHELRAALLLLLTGGAAA